MHPLLLIVIATISFGSYSIFMKLASPHVNQVFGAAFVSVVGASIGMIVWLLTQRHVPIYTDPKGLLFIALTGTTVFITEYLVLRIYSGGVPITISAPIIVGGGLAFSVITGVFLGESMTLVKLAGIGCVLAGAVILSVFAH